MKAAFALLSVLGSGRLLRAGVSWFSRPCCQELSLAMSLAVQGAACEECTPTIKRPKVGAIQTEQRRTAGSSAHVAQCITAQAHEEYRTQP